MKKTLALAVFAAALIAAPVFAATTPSDVSADVDAVQKDNGALQKDNDAIAQHRAAKAKAKANGDIAGQAGQSLSIGADKTARSEKTTEKDVDQHILNHDVNDATQSTGK